MKHFVSKLLICRQKWAAGVRHGNSLVVFRVLLGIGHNGYVILNKICCSSSIKPGILKLTTSKGKNQLAHSL